MGTVEAKWQWVDKVLSFGSMKACPGSLFSEGNDSHGYLLT